MAGMDLCLHVTISLKPAKRVENGDVTAKMPLPGIEGNLTH